MAVFFKQILGSLKCQVNRLSYRARKSEQSPNPVLFLKLHLQGFPILSFQHTAIMQGCIICIYRTHNYSLIFYTYFPVKPHGGLKSIPAYFRMRQSAPWTGCQSREKKNKQLCTLTHISGQFRVIHPSIHYPYPLSPIQGHRDLLEPIPAFFG